MSYDYESYSEPLTSPGNMEFSDKSIRMGFIRKVYMILMAQLTVTFGMVAVFSLSVGVRKFVNSNPALFYVALAGTLICIIALSCCGNVRRRTPHNFIFLGIFTVCEGFLLGTAAASFTKNEILIAVGVTVVVTLSLTIFAFQTKFDFTTCGMFVFVSVIILFMFGILALIIQDPEEIISNGGAWRLKTQLEAMAPSRLISQVHPPSMNRQQYIYQICLLMLSYHD